MHTRYNYGFNWFVVFLFMAVVIAIVIYTANAPLGNILLDGMKLLNGVI